MACTHFPSVLEQSCFCNVCHLVDIQHTRVTMPSLSDCYLCVCAQRSKNMALSMWNLHYPHMLFGFSWGPQGPSHRPRHANELDSGLGLSARISVSL